MAINDILEFGRMGMNANRKAMETTQNNIANANTEGYTRQRAEFNSRPGRSVQGQVMGGGVEISKIIRVHDGFVNNQILDESKMLGSLRMKAETLGRAQGTLQTEGERLNDLLNNFFSDIREASASPEFSTLRTVLKNSGEGVGIGFRKMSEAIDALRADTDLRIDATVREVNSLSKELAEINNQFVSGLDVPNELYDRKDQIIRQMAEKIDIQTFPDERGRTNVVVGNMMLVQADQANMLETRRTEETPGKAPGAVDIFIQDMHSSRKVTGNVKEGILGGLIQVRDMVLTKTQENLDSLAHSFANRVNELHREGVGGDGGVGRDLFALSSEGVKGAAGSFTLSRDILENPDGVAIGFDGTAGDNRLALAIGELQNTPIHSVLGSEGIGEPKLSIQQGITSMVSDLGSRVAREQQFYDHQQAVVRQLDNYRESVSGVSLEEEAINLMRYQTVFNASAKALKTGDELLQTILSLKN